MRIISGTHRGRKIHPPKKLPVRPTTDKSKEALFNILDNRYYFQEISVLDLFSGTGNMSYEFASRGVTKISSVDSHHGCVKFIDETSIRFNLPIVAVKSNVFKYIEHIRSQFDIIFADPPYSFSIKKFLEIITKVFKYKLLTKNGVLVVEHSKMSCLSSHEKFSHTRNYGDTAFSFFENRASLKGRIPDNLKRANL